MIIRHVTRKPWNGDVDPRVIVAVARQIPILEADALARLIESNMPRRW